MTGTFSVDPATVHPVTVNGQGVSADGLAINSKGELFAYAHTDIYTPPLGNGTAQLIIINPNDGTATEIGNPLPNARIAGAAFDMDDNLWVLDWISMQLIEINPSDGSVQSKTPPVTTPNFTFSHTTQGAFADIAFDVDNNCYFSTNQGVNYTNALLYSLNLKTGVASPLLPTLSNSLSSPSQVPGPTGMAFHRNGEVWFTNNSGDRRILYSPDVGTLSAAHAAVPDLSNIMPLTQLIDLAARPNRVTAKDDSAVTLVNAPVTISVLGNDFYWNKNHPGVDISVDDSGALPVSTWPKTTAYGGTASLNPDGTVAYTPAAGFVGIDTFTYRIVAQDGFGATATVKISVQTAVPANNPVALVGLALGMVGAGGFMLRRQRKQAR